jgi:protocatechuate 3,4-dioxygenase beta subunit
MSRDAKNHGTARTSTRREALRTIGIALAAAPLGQLLACSSDASTSGGGGGSSGEAWATGGTASMTGTYPDPFTSGLGATCALSCASTLGPCYAATLVRKDISEAQKGLPVRLAFLVVDEACKPVEGATIDIWHTSPAGLYSGEDASDMCTSGDATARASKWFRGVQTTDSKGRVDFDTCFPGWYRGRTIHIHFTVRVKDVEYVTSQLFFEDAMVDEIVAEQPIYKDRGARDTTNKNDNVISEAAVAEYVFQTERMDDGAMLAWKTLVVRSSTATALCSIPRGTGGGGPGA